MELDAGQVTGRKRGAFMVLLTFANDFLKLILLGWKKLGPGTQLNKRVSVHKDVILEKNTCSLILEKSQLGFGLAGGDRMMCILSLGKMIVAPVTVAWVRWTTEAWHRESDNLFLLNECSRNISDKKIISKICNYLASIRAATTVQAKSDEAWADGEMKTLGYGQTICYRIREGNLEVVWTKWLNGGFTFPCDW